MIKKISFSVITVGFLITVFFAFVSKDVEAQVIRDDVIIKIDEVDYMPIFTHPFNNIVPVRYAGEADFLVAGSVPYGISAQFHNFFPYESYDDPLVAYNFTDYIIAPLSFHSSYDISGSNAGFNRFLNINTLLNNLKKMELGYLVPKAASGYLQGGAKMQGVFYNYSLGYDISLVYELNKFDSYYNRYYNTYGVSITYSLPNNHYAYYKIGNDSSSDFNSIPLQAREMVLSYVIDVPVIDVNDSSTFDSFETHFFTQVMQGVGQKYIRWQYFDLSGNQIGSGYNEYNVPFGADLPDRFGLFTIYNADLIEFDYQTVYDSGYNDGRIVGNTVGYDNGYSIGHGIGMESGLTQGFDTGYTNARAFYSKFINGNWRTYDYAYAAGFNAGNTSQPATLASVLLAVFNGIGALLSINLFGDISIGAVLAVPLIFSIMYFIVGKRR